MTNPTKAISRMHVQKLFGTYDYTLAPSPHARRPERLLILYGDNGSGKTTILTLLFRLLAPETGAGHKSAVAKIPFGLFEVQFTSGDHVWAKRPEGKLTGSFTMGLRLGRGREKTAHFLADADMSVKGTAKVTDFLSRLGQLNIGLCFLSDDRTVNLAGREPRESTFPTPESSGDEVVLYHDFPSQLALISPTRDAQEQARQLLLTSLKRAESWIQSQVVRGASEGESSVNTLYSEILKSIAQLPLEKNAKSSDTVAKIDELVQRLESRSREYSRYGLLPEFNGRDILAVVKSAPPSHLSIIKNVISPYIESVQRKLDAMAQLQRQIDTLVGIVNSFFTRKTLAFEIHRGFEILSEGGKPLPPQVLSSGERHLLLLFCNTLVAFDRPSIFIIDEPEISLNIKWQRRLLASLLECAGENAVQYLFATHSFEVLAQHKDNVLKLLANS
jgi:energy-coupling factor transporter ATP-binding protein EcfA2